MLMEAIVACFELHRPTVERLENATKKWLKKLASGPEFEPRTSRV
jgi:hypothetical protein